VKVLTVLILIVVCL